MVSLLALVPRRGRDLAALRRPVPLLGMAGVASFAVSLVGLAGLALSLVVVQTLDPSGGLAVGDSVAVAGRLWLLAQGGELDVGSGPLVMAPLLLTLGITWGLSQAGRGFVRLGDVGTWRQATQGAAVLVAVHVLIGVLLTLTVDGPAAQIGLLRTTAGTAVLAVVAVGWGVGRESGLLDEVLDGLPGNVRPMLRGVLAGLLAAMAMCTVVVLVALAADASGYAALSRSLGGAAAGALGLLALGVLLLPNAAAAVLGLAAGPGFYVGSGTLVSVHGVTLSPVPALPMLAALPDTQAVPLIAFVSQVIPGVAGLVAGVAVGRHLPGRDGGSVVAGLTGLLSGVLLGVVSGVVVWVAGGSLGDGSLSQVGAPVLATAIAVGAQSGITAAVAAAVARWRSLA